MKPFARSAFAALIAVAAAGCADRGGGAAKPNPPTTATDATATTTTDATDATDATQGDAMSDVTITNAGERPGRPPLIRLLVHVTAANPGKDTRWVLIQSKIPDNAGGVDKLEQLTAPGGTLGRFLGNGGSYVVALAPGAKLTIKNLEIGWWNEDDAKTPPPIQVRTGTGVTVGGADIKTWFTGDPAVSGTVEIDAAKAEHTHSKRSDGDREVPLQVVGGQTTTVTVR
jgi:hypothetical protein